MRLYNAFRRGYITQEQYEHYLDEGFSANSTWVDPDPETPDPDIPVSTNSYAEAMNIVSTGMQKKTIAIENLGITNSLDYKIECYVDDILCETIERYVSPENTEVRFINDAYDKIILYVKSTISDSSTTYNTKYAYY